MFSISASGSFAGAIEYVRWIKDPFRIGKDRSGVAFVRGKKLPLVPMTKDVVSVRNTLAAGVSVYHDESQVDAEDRNSWLYYASNTGMSGFNRYLRKFIESNLQREAPWNIPSPE